MHELTRNFLSLNTPKAIFSNQQAFAALKFDGSVATWGATLYGGSGHADVPIDAGYVTIHATASSFTAMKADGTVRTWGRGIEQSKVPTIAFKTVYSSAKSFAGINPSGTYEYLSV